MTYKIIETIEDKKSDEETSLVLLVETSAEHVAVDFEGSRYTKVNRWRFESGYVKLDETTTVEITRILMSCSKGHDHGVYYQAPRHMELWEAFFALGEVPEALEGLSLFEEGNDDGISPKHPE